MFKNLLPLFCLLCSSVLLAEKTNKGNSETDQEFISISSNWNQFLDLISKPESQNGESEYEKIVRNKLIEITNAPHQSLKAAATKDHQARVQAISNAKKLAPIINIWTEEWRRAIELRTIQADVQISGDDDLSAELGENLQNSINIRQSQLDLLQHNQSYLALNQKVKRRTQHISDLQNKNKNQAQMIEHLKTQLAKAKNAVPVTSKPKVTAPKATTKKVAQPKAPAVPKATKKNLPKN